MRVRPFADADLPALYAIQSDCPPAARWHQRDYLQLAASPGGLILVAESGPEFPQQLLGFAAFHRIDDEAEVRNVAVAPLYQRRGIARQMLLEGIRRLHEAGTRRIFLEVRSSNQPARELYTSLGFKIWATRKHYYQDPEEDAVVMLNTLNT